MLMKHLMFTSTARSRLERALFMTLSSAVKRGIYG